MLGIGEPPSKAFELGFQVASTGIRGVFFCVFDIAYMDTIHQEFMEIIPIKSFNSLSQSEAFVKFLVENTQTPTLGKEPR